MDHNIQKTKTMSGLRVVFFVGTLFSLFFALLWITQSTLNITGKRVPTWIAVLTLVLAIPSGLFALTSASCDAAAFFGADPFGGKGWLRSPCRALAKSEEHTAERWDMMRSQLHRPDASP